MAFGWLLAVLFSLGRMNLSMGIYVDALSGLQWFLPRSCLFFLPCLLSTGRKRKGSCHRRILWTVPP